MTKKQPKRKLRPGVDEYGRTDLHYAANDGNIARVRALLDAGADPSAPDDDGWTPLHFAVQSGSVAVCEVLLQAGAGVDPRDSYGNTPLSKAVFRSEGEGEIIQLLRAHGANPVLANHYGVSPVSLARTIANYDVTRFFTDLPEQDVPQPQG